MKQNTLSRATFLFKVASACHGWSSHNISMSPWAGGDYQGQPPYRSTDTTLSFLNPHGCSGMFQLSLAKPHISMYLPSD